MNFLIIADIVGKSGMDKLKETYPIIVKNSNIDFTIVNGENSANGKGIRMQEYNDIISLGVDVITMGNHIYYRKEMADEYIKLDKLILPANVTNLKFNKIFTTTKNNKTISVINLLGKVGLNEITQNNVTCPFDKSIELISNLKSDYIFVDFHAEATAEKIALGYHLDGKVTCVYGTHTHVQTSDETILPNNTAYITDVGMTGPKDSVIGLEKSVALTRFASHNIAKYVCSQNESMLNAIIVKTDDTTSKVISITRVRM